MKYLLDTGACVYAINTRPQSVFDRLKRERVGEIALSSIALAELREGAALDDFITPLEILEYGERQSEEYGRIRSYLERQGQPIGSMDTLIAAHAVSLGITLVTNNLREFGRVPGLTIETWT
jgi:tRNA(fMet)-specific endonuclease VapC